MTPKQLNDTELLLAIILVIAIGTVFADLFLWRP